MLAHLVAGDPVFPDQPIDGRLGNPKVLRQLVDIENLVSLRHYSFLSVGRPILLIVRAGISLLSDVSQFPYDRRVLKEHMQGLDIGAARETARSCDEGVLLWSL